MNIVMAVKDMLDNQKTDSFSKHGYITNKCIMINLPPLDIKVSAISTGNIYMLANFYSKTI